jgi:serine phosphatase RsbU (regulator of sigma subunit)/Tfp pilus assembly protein PilF
MGKHRTVVFILFALLCADVLSQPLYCDKKYCLIDSLDLKVLSAEDKVLLDSCLTDYHAADSDTLRLKNIAYLANGLSESRIWHAYAVLMYNEAHRCLSKKNPEAVQRRLFGIAGTASHYLGYYYFQIIRNDSISEFYNLKNLEYQKKSGNKKQIALALYSLAANYSTEGKVSEAMTYYQDALKVFEELKDTSHVADSYQNIGYLLQNQKDVEGAMKYFQKALKLYSLKKKKKDMADCYSFLADCYKSRNLMDSALISYRKAEELFLSLNDEYGIATILLNKGELFERQGKLDTALQSYKESLRLFERTQDKNPISFALNSLAVVYYKKGDLENARKAGERSMLLAKEIQYPDNIRNAAKVLTDIYKKGGNYRDALEMHELYARMNDSILNADTRRNAIEKDLKYQHDKELLEVEKEREKEAIAAQKEKEKRNIIIISISAGLLLVIIFMFFLYNRFRLISKQKEIIEIQKEEVEIQKKEVEVQKDLVDHRNQEILDSITYARRLQQAILPQKKVINELLPDSFVLYKPKDIVAGDFYWIEHVGDKVIIAAADCTGHGVPGAMVSFVCVNALNRAVLEFGLIEPASILDKVSELVVGAFRRSEDQVKDGMDISLCVLDKKTLALQYAGAYNPIWILKQGAAEMDEYTATRQAVGNVLSPVPFISNTIPLSKGDTVYMFSDGYADQFGGEKGKKMKYSNFRKILLGINHLPMQEQSEKLDSSFESWRGELEQVDDVCVIGLRI